MSVKVRTNGEVIRAYVGTMQVLDRDGKVDPIRVALAQLRLDCNADREKLMRDFHRQVIRTVWTRGEGWRC